MPTTKGTLPDSYSLDCMIPRGAGRYLRSRALLLNEVFEPMMQFPIRSFLASSTSVPQNGGAFLLEDRTNRHLALRFYGAWPGLACRVEVPPIGASGSRDIETIRIRRGGHVVGAVCDRFHRRCDRQDRAALDLVGRKSCRKIRRRHRQKAQAGVIIHRNGRGQAPVLRDLGGGGLNFCVTGPILVADGLFWPGLEKDGGNCRRS